LGGGDGDGGICSGRGGSISGATFLGMECFLRGNEMG